jgi:pimeloyl-ACP methyl ester carboxylesterase
MVTTQARRSSTYRQSGMALTDRSFVVPLNHGEPDGEQIELYAREVTAVDKLSEDLPWLAYLQGGPGMASPRPIGPEGWLRRALQDYRVLLVDQRGTGRSTPVHRHSLARIGKAGTQADHLALFRADSIVRDVEAIREQLIGDQPWSVLGASFGGHCAVTYLSFAPSGLREVFIAGGLPSLDATADDIYRAAYPRVEARNALHYDRYPDDAAHALRIAHFLRNHDVRLPSGAQLTVEAFQSLGRLLGMTAGGHQLHYLLEDAFAGEPELSDAFLIEVDSHLAITTTSPLYALLHEPLYAQGHATRWSAQRLRVDFLAFDSATALDGHAPLLFTGEMIYPWMFDIDPRLQPLGPVANQLAERDTWPALYDIDRLRTNEVPVAAVVYYDDMYVDRDLSMQTANVIRGLRSWVTNEYEHDGIRVSDGAILDRLIALARGTA